MMTQHSSMAMKQSIDDADDANYQRMIERFDCLWAAAPSEHGGQEMQKLLPLIEQYETEQYEAAQRDGAIQIAGAERKPIELPHRITVAQNSST